MKKTILKNWMTALLVSGVCCGFVACNNKDENPMPAPTPDATAVIGAYSGTMDVVVLTPNEGEGDGPTGTKLDATVTGELIQFENFPIRDLVITIVGDEKVADEIIKKVGQIDYSVPYTALLDENKTGVRLTLKPEPLKLTLKADSESLEEPAGLEIEVEVVALVEGAYNIEWKSLGFGLSVASVKVDGVEIPGFEPFSFDFDLTKN